MSAAAEPIRVFYNSASASVGLLPVHRAMVKEDGVVKNVEYTACMEFDSKVGTDPQANGYPFRDARVVAVGVIVEYISTSNAQTYQILQLAKEIETVDANFAACMKEIKGQDDKEHTPTEWGQRMKIKWSKLVRH